MRQKEPVIELVTNITDSIVFTLKSNGYIIGKDQVDMENGNDFFHVYRFGRIVKTIIFQNDERHLEKNS